MNAVLLMLAAHLAVLSSEFGSDIRTTDNEWASFKLGYNKHYSNVAEESLRRQIYAYNVHEINLSNQLNSNGSYTLGINRFTDMVIQELQPSGRSDIGSSQLKPMNILQDKDLEMLIGNPTDPLPDHIDWRKVHGVVSRVKDQGDTCISSWTISTVGLLEGQQRTKRGANSTLTSAGRNLIPLSSQQLIDCDLLDNGCRGGDITGAIDYIIRAGGIQAQKDYPLTGKEQPCKFKKSKVVMTVNGSSVLATKDEELLKKTVATYGPVSVGINVARSLMSYESGVLDDKLCPNWDRPMPQFALIVGYGTTEAGQDYWIVKNSWGTKWGEKGYARLARGKNQCGIAIIPVIATL